MDALCPYNPIDTFFVDLEMLETLFDSIDDEEKSLKVLSEKENERPGIKQE